MVYPVRKVPDVNTFYDVGQDAGMEQKWSHEYKRPCSVGAKDNEAQWHDDLTKWKNRRRSSKSDQRRKSLDREHVVKQMINGASNNFEKKGAHGGLQKRDLQSPHRHNSAPRPYSTSFSSKSSSSDLRPRTRALLARSYAIEAPFSPAAHIQGSSAGLMPASDGNILGEAAHFASLASDGAGVTTPSVDCPYSSQTQVKAQGILAPFHPTSDLAQPENIITNHISTLVTTIQPKESAKSTRTRDPTTLISSHKEPPLERGRSLQATGVYKYLSRAGTWSGSSSLPRGYRRLEGSSRLSSAITARPFGTKHSRMSSLPRLSHKDDIQGLPLKSEKEESLSPPFGSSLKRQTASAHLKAPCLDSVQQKRADQAKQNGTEHGKGVRGVTLSSRTSSQTNIYQHQPYSQTQLLLQPYSSLQTHHKKSPTLPSNGGIDRIKVDHSDMRVSLALKPNSRPDFGFQTHWDSTGARIKYIQPGSPAELCQLCVDDEIVAVNGVAVTHMNYSQWKDKMTSYLQTGNLAMDIRRYGNKDWSSSEGIHHNQPGQSRVTLNLTASQPVLIGYADPHGNGGASSETTVTKVSKFNGQADNVMQGKVMHGQLADNRRTATSKDYNACVRENKKRREEFFNKKGGSESAISDLQVPSLSPSSSSWSWDPEEHRRRQEKWQEEQERLLQEQYQRDQERLESEWRRAQQEVVGELCRKSGNTFEMTNGGQSSLSTHGLTNKTREVEQSPELKGGVSDPPSNAKGVQNVKITEQAWAEDSCGFAQLSAQHRGKSLSTPSLPSLHKQTKVDQRRTIGHSVSNVEKERQLILEEMKKKTQLLTDNSWIRQRRSSFYKEPIYVGAPIKRYESLDNLDTLRQSPLSTVTFTYPRPHSVASGYCAPSRNAASRYSTSATLSQRNASVDSFNHGRMVSGRRTCCVCERVLGSGAAMVIEALSVCFHLACFQCVGCHRHLRGTGSGAQVRISNRKPYCEPCYFELKSADAPSL